MGLATASAHAQTAQTLSARFKDGLIFVDVQANGEAGVFLLDTGANKTVFSRPFADRAFVRLGRARDITGRGGEIDARQGGAVVLSLVDGPSQRVEPVVFDLSQPSQAMGVPLAGILGEDVLRDFVVILDYRDERVMLAREAVDPADATPLTVGAAPYVVATASLKGRTAQGVFEIDTGSNTAVEFWRPFARAAFGEGLGVRRPGLGVAGLSVVEDGRIDALDVAGRRIVSPAVNFADETPASDPVARYGGVIGGPAWSGLVVTLDLPHRLIWLR